MTTLISAFALEQNVSIQWNPRAALHHGIAHTRLAQKWDVSTLKRQGTLTRRINWSWRVAFSTSKS